MCAACRRHLERRQDEPPGSPIGLAASQPRGIVQLEWSAAYSGPARACLHALKYDGELRLVQPLAELMAARWRRAGIGGDLLVPVPVHPARRRQRGFDQAELLARALGTLIELPVATALERREQTTAQHALGRGARAANVGHAFGVSKGQGGRLRGAWVVLIDDLTTTGATFGGCARIAYESGAWAVSALALARER